MALSAVSPALYYLFVLKAGRDRVDTWTGDLFRKPLADVDL
jgi:hypothetical protein